MADYSKGAIVKVRAGASGPRPGDRTIAALAGPDGLYRVDRHLADARRDVRAGDDPEAFVEAHVRRLGALRRSGLVERVEEGLWRAPSDFLDRTCAADPCHGISRDNAASAFKRHRVKIEIEKSLVNRVQY